MAADETARLRTKNKRLLDELMTARRQNEHMLATIRQLYDDVRAEQSREAEQLIDQQDLADRWG